MSHAQIKEHGILDKDGQEAIRTAMAQLYLSARAYDRILNVSRIHPSLILSAAPLFSFLT